MIPDLGEVALDQVHDAVRALVVVGPDVSELDRKGTWLQVSSGKEVRRYDKNGNSPPDVSLLRVRHSCEVHFRGGESEGAELGHDDASALSDL